MLNTYTHPANAVANVVNDMMQIYRLRKDLEDVIRGKVTPSLIKFSHVSASAGHVFDVIVDDGRRISIGISSADGVSNLYIIDPLQVSCRSDSLNLIWYDELGYFLTERARRIGREDSAISVQVSDIVNDDFALIDLDSKELAELLLDIKNSGA